MTRERDPAAVPADIVEENLSIAHARGRDRGTPTAIRDKTCRKLLGSVGVWPKLCMRETSRQTAAVSRAAYRSMSRRTSLLGLADGKELIVDCRRSRRDARR